MHLKVHDGSNSEAAGWHRKINYLGDNPQRSGVCRQEEFGAAGVGMWSCVQNGRAFECY
jgi:hypothetical protein